VRGVIKKILKENLLLLESLEDRLFIAFEKWFLNLRKKSNYEEINETLLMYKEGKISKNHFEKFGLILVLPRTPELRDVNSEETKKLKELYIKGDYSGIHEFVARLQMKNYPDFEKNFRDWISYRNQMKSPDIFQYKSYDEFYSELLVGKNKSFTKRLKKASKGLDYENIWENEDMVVIVPKTHIGACKYGQGTKWCTASKHSDKSFKKYYTEGILYRIIQKNDNYKKFIYDYWSKLGSDYGGIENLSMVSLNLGRSNNHIEMRDREDRHYNKKMTIEFLNILPNNLYKEINYYHNSNR
jgi:hypothetical protein